MTRHLLNHSLGSDRAQVNRRRSVRLLFSILFAALPTMAQDGARNGEWRVYGGDGGSTRYSALDQISRDNVKDLKPAWTWRSDNFGRPEFKNESTPIMANGMLYFTAG